MSSERQPAKDVSWRNPQFALGLACASFGPWLPGAAGPGDAYVALGLSGVVLPACGCAAALGGVDWRRAGLAVSWAWTASFVVAALIGPRALEAGWSWLALACLWAGWGMAGAGSGARLVRRGETSRASTWSSGAGLCLVWVASGALLTGLPGRVERVPKAPSAPAGWAQSAPDRAALLLDISPATWAFEVAGVDWMRHPAVYEPAGTDWFSGSRRPWSGGVAGPLALVLGCAFGGCCAGLRGKRETSLHTSG